MDDVLALSSPKKAEQLSQRMRRPVTRVASANALLKRLAKGKTALVIVDIGSVKEQELVHRLKGSLRDAPLVLVDDLAKFDPGSLSSLLGKAVSSRRLRKAGQKLRLQPDLHNPKSGCIDAVHVARFFGFSMAKLAKVMGRSPQAVHKTPDAASLQSPLGLFLRIATSLVALFGSEEHARIWLNTPHPDLDNVRPVELIERRRGDIVAALLEDHLTGHPG